MTQANPQAMLNGWKDRLLDTGRRNQLVGFKEYKASTLRLIYPDLPGFSELIGQKKIAIENLFKEASKEDIFSDEPLETEGVYNVAGFSIAIKEKYTPSEVLPIIRNQKRDKTVYSNFNYAREQKVLRNLKNKAKEFKEENAIDILYIAIGFLKWYDSENSHIETKSPLLFLPVKILQESLNSPFYLDLQEDEILLNETLIKKMNQDFGIDLAYEFKDADDTYTMISSYQNHVRQKIATDRWEVTDDIYIGLFKFSRISMYEDLETNFEDILENEIVNALSGEFIEDLNTPYELDDEKLDARMIPENLFQVYDADSSQERAIQAAIEGKSFVLQGPPGTGKSQTITNIISELLARGKKVLFVAEKKAALDVVFSNLEKVNLHKFSLPLHNSKINKKDFIKDLRSELDSRQKNSVIDDQVILSLNHDLSRSKSDLSKYAEAITSKKPPFNKSLYDAYGNFSKYRDSKELSFDVEELIKRESVNLSVITEEISNFEHTYRELGVNPDESIWYGINLTNISPLYTNELINKLKNHLLILQNLYQSLEVFDEHIPLTELISINRVFELHHKLIKHIQKFPNISDQILKIFDIKNEKRMLETLKDSLVEIQSLRGNIEAHFELSILDNYEALNTQSIIQNNTFFRRIFSNEYKVSKQVFMSFSKSSKLNSEVLFNSAMNLIRLDSANKVVHDLSNKLTLSINIDDMNELSNYISTLTWMIEFEEIIDSVEGISWNWNPNACAWLQKVYENFKPEQISIKEKADHWMSEFSDFTEELQANALNLWESKNSNSLTLLIQNLISREKELNILKSIDFYYQNGLEYGLRDFYDKVFEARINQDLVGVFFRHLYLSLIDTAFRANPELQVFDSAKFNDIKEKFMNSDKKQIKLSKYRIEEKLIANTPMTSGTSGLNSEVVILKRESEKKRKLMPVRKLFNEIPNLILDLKPCVMMSPLSVSTYLSSKDLKFDAVIFDEASQIQPESAIGAIYRAYQVIIVGDKEQLPPTSFFSNYGSDEYEEDDFDDYESILELASASLSSISLKWHYRSKYENLINISNREIYKDLVTFPSQHQPNDEFHEGVTYHYVENAIYQRGKSSESTKATNPAEADEVIQMVFKHFEIFGTARSLGVVAFNSAQADLIESKLLRIRADNDQYQAYFNENLEEPFFIKNIETVQGDERDTIILSTTYGYDKTGKLSMNFGAINQDAGYRRLNVAITRSRINMLIVTSLKPTDIRIGENTKKGLHFLKTYLEYAESGEDIKVDSFDPNAEFDSAFEEDVYKEIINLGFQAQSQVGSSGFKIDLAVIDPTNSKKFILGIECDGATYHRSKAARDRDRLRQEILELRGWRIYRIWSTDWFKNRENEINRLKQVIINSIKQPTPIDKDTDSDEELTPVLVEKKREINKVEFETYPSKEALLIYSSSGVSERLESIMMNTSPVHIETLKKIVPEIYGRQKFTSVVSKEFYHDYRQQGLHKIFLNKKDFYYRDNQEIVFRKTGNKSFKRLFYYIAFEELSHAYNEILKEAKNITIDTLKRQILELTGYKKMSKDMEAHFKKSIEFFISNYDAYKNDQNIILKS